MEVIKGLLVIVFINCGLFWGITALTRFAIKRQESREKAKNQAEQVKKA